MGLFSKIKEAKSNSGGVYFEPGQYELECLAVKTGVTREGSKPFFVAEFLILSSTCPARAAGTTVSYMVMMDKYVETALGNVKQCVAALFACPEAEVDEAGVEAVIGPDNPAKGARVKAIATMIKTRAQKDFTKVVFSPMEREGAAA